MKLFFSYLKTHKKSILLFFSFSVVYFIISFLYSMPMEAALYAFILCFVFGSIAVIADFIRFKRKYTDLIFLTENIEWGLQSLPDADNITEEAYRDLIESLSNALMQAKTAAKNKIDDTNEYYTLWIHQIKTPIAALRLLLSEHENDEMEEQLFRIEQYVEMVLTYIRCGNDASDYVIKRIDLDKTVRQCIRKFSRSFIRKKISMHFTPTDMQVLTDEKWLAFVIEQLLSNALKYTKTGSISVYTEDGKNLVIQDTGIGIAEEDLPRITQKGYTGYNGRLDKKSTGLGLFLCGKILDALGHTITVTSQIGEGTAVKIGFLDKNIRYE